MKNSLIIDNHQSNDLTKLIALMTILVLIAVTVIASISSVTSEGKQTILDIKHLSSEETQIKTIEKNVLLWPVDNGIPGNTTLWKAVQDGKIVESNKNGEVNKTANEYGMTIDNVTSNSKVVAPGDGQIVSLEYLKEHNKAEAFLTDIEGFEASDTIVIKLNKLSSETREILDYRFKDESVEYFSSIVPDNTLNLYILISNINVSNGGTGEINRGATIGTPKTTTKDEDEHSNGTDSIFVKMFKENGELVENLEEYLSSEYTKTDEEAYKKLKDKKEVGEVIDVPLVSADADDYIVKTDLPGACTVVTDKELLEKGIEKWLKSTPKQVTNAKSILDAMIKYQEQYKVNLVFVYAVFKLEQAMGTAKCPPGYIPQSYNNWGSIKAKYGTPGKDPSTWKKFATTTEMVEHEMKLFAETGPYFKNQRYSVKSIAPTYCNEAWGTKVIKFMNEFYKALGVSSNSGDGSSPFIEQETDTGSFLLKMSGDGFSDVTKAAVQGGYTYYRNYKQARGSYANNSYWGSKIRSKGCGPTTTAVILSGYGIEASPADCAKIMGSTGAGTIQKCLAKYGLDSKIVYFSGSSVSQIKQVITEQLKKKRPLLVSVHSNSLNLTKRTHLIAVLEVNSDGSKFLVSNVGTVDKNRNGWLDANKFADAATGRYCVLLQSDPKPMNAPNGSDTDTEADNTNTGTGGGSDTEQNTVTYPSGTSYTKALTNTLFIGDSYIARLKNYASSISGSYFAGHGSQTAATFLNNYNSWVEVAFNGGKKYDRIIMYLGVNQTSSSTDKMKSLIQKIKTNHPGIPIYVCEVMNLGKSYKYYNSKTKQMKTYNEGMKSYCNSTSGVYYINTSNGLVVNGYLTPCDSSGIHIEGKTANLKWTQNMADAIANTK